MYARFPLSARKTLMKLERTRVATGEFDAFHDSAGPTIAVKPRVTPVLREQAANERGFSHASHAENHRSGARRNVVLTHGIHHFVESAHHNLLQPHVHLFAVPKQPFLVLHP